MNCQGTAIPPVPPIEGDFDAFWAAFPRKEAKLAARTAYLKAIQGDKRKKRSPVEPAAILAGAERYARDRAGKDPQFTVMPTTWLNQGRWDDQPATPVRAVSNGYQPWTNPADHAAYDEELLP